MRFAFVAMLLFGGVLVAQTADTAPQKLTPRKVKESKQQVDTEKFVEPENRQSVDEEIMRGWGALTADELLAWVVGVPTQNAGLLTEKVSVNMRGMPGRYGAQRTLVLLDNIPLNEEFMGDVDFRFIPTEALGSVKVLRGVTSAEFGGVGTAGAILLETMKVREAPLCRVRTGLGDYDTEVYSALHGARYGRLKWLAAGGYARTEGYLVNFDSTPRNWEQARGLAKASLVLTPSIAVSSLTAAASAHGCAAYFNQKSTRDIQAITLASQEDPRRAWDFSATLWRTGLDTDYTWRAFSSTGRYHQHTLGAKGTSTFRAGIHSLKCGVSYKEQFADTRDISGSLEATIYSTSFFAEDSVHYRLFRIRFGVRYDDDSASGDSATPRVCASFLPVRWLLIRGAVGKTWRAPSISDLLLPETNYGNAIFRGNRNLKPETAWTYEVGSRVRFSVKRRSIAPFSLYADAAIFHTDARDFYDYLRVGTAPQSGLPIFEPRNVPGIGITGTELSARLSNILPKLHLIINYAYTNAKYTDYPLDPSIKGNNLEYIPSHYGTAALLYTPNPETTLMFWCRASDHRNTDIHNWKDLNLRAYAIFGIRAAVVISDLKTARIRVLLSVDNLTNKEYQEYRGVPMPPRTFSVSMEVEF